MLARIRNTGNYTPETGLIQALAEPWKTSGVVQYSMLNRGCTQYGLPGIMINETFINSKTATTISDNIFYMKRFQQIMTASDPVGRDLHLPGGDRTV